MVSLALHLLLLLALSGWLPSSNTPAVNLPLSSLQVTLLTTPAGPAPQRAQVLAQHDSQGSQHATPLSAATPQAEQQSPAPTRVANARLLSAQPATAQRPQAKLATAAVGVSWASYVEDWRHRVEDIGNRNYPPEARQQNLFGSLELLVTIRADGALLDVRVLRSSGTAVLDEAALRIVRQAAPYPPFPSTLAAEYGSLQVVRKWTFTTANQLAGS
ncbi:TonB family protein [Vogesella sp. GCM10023246]|uniref:TonB family protein n=1 Tax=Vogesella oryzagri TaxID=3160864 RepID=A0ABV1M4G3_9NEIS